MHRDAPQCPIMRLTFGPPQEYSSGSIKLTSGIPMFVCNCRFSFQIVIANENYQKISLNSRRDTRPRCPITHAWEPNFLSAVSGNWGFS